MHGPSPMQFGEACQRRMQRETWDVAAHRGHMSRVIVDVFCVEVQYQGGLAFTELICGCDAGYPRLERSALSPWSNPFNRSRPHSIIVRMDDTNPKLLLKAPSGRFVLRMDPGLHSALRSSAEAMGVSLNEFCVRRLAMPNWAAQSGGFIAEATLAAFSAFGESLLGLIAFGSWARGESGPGSDIDLLIVLDDAMRITRQLHAAWDRLPLRDEMNVIEPHPVHLPATSHEFGGIWPEVALDGIVLYERDFRISRLLARIRGQIARGKIVRRTIHGQPYWSAVA